LGVRENTSMPVMPVMPEVPRKKFLGLI